MIEPIYSSVSYWDRPEGRDRPCGKLKLLLSGKRVYIPVTQEPAPVTEDKLEEQAEVRNRTPAAVVVVAYYDIMKRIFKYIFHILVKNVKEGTNEILETHVNYKVGSV